MSKRACECVRACMCACMCACVRTWVRVSFTDQSAFKKGINEAFLNRTFCHAINDLCSMYRYEIINQKCQIQICLQTVFVTFDLFPSLAWWW